jgi:hypothetical protein
MPDRDVSDLAVTPLVISRTIIAETFSSDRAKKFLAHALGGNHRLKAKRRANLR